VFVAVDGLSCYSVINSLNIQNLFCVNSYPDINTASEVILKPSSKT
jgi:hypothetical protein